MKLKNHLIFSIFLAISCIASGQSGIQSKADNLFNNFDFVNATTLYKELISKNYNTDYVTRQVADSYAFMRNPDSEVVYYKKVVIQPNVPTIYFYKYAQALRGVKDYKESRIWFKKFKNAGGEIKEETYLKDDEFLNAIFNAKQNYFLKEVKFNSKYSDFAAFEHNNDLYFVSARDEGVSTKNRYSWNEEPFLDIYVTNKSANTANISHKSKIKGAVNTTFHEGPLTISKDGQTMYFSRNDFNNQVLDKNTQGVTNLKIYKASLEDGKWTNVVELPFNSNSYSISHPALNKDGSKLYFTSDMPGGYGGTDLYYVEVYKNGTYSAPQNLGNNINTSKNECFPFLNNENALFFASDGHPGLGLLDIFAAVTNKNNAVISILNLGIPVNSNKDDFSFFMSDDGLSGYFASNRDGGIGSDDIYAFSRIPTLKLEGTISDAVTKNPVANAVTTLFDTNNKPIANAETDLNGHYSINIDLNTDYSLKTTKQNYVDNTTVITSKGMAANTTSVKANIVLNPVPLEDIPITELVPIYFDFNKYDLRRDSTVELDRIVDLMTNSYPNMAIKIESHTDSRGPTTYNEILSEERAKATYDYLIKKGVNPDRILGYKGFGERKLTNNCDGTISCTEEQHQLNRRTQFIVIKMK